MNTSYNWIKAYVPGLSAGNQEYFDKMTLSGTKVEGFAPLDKNLDRIVVGKIEKLEPHPNANKLVVCQVNVGQEAPLQIVTGAPNALADSSSYVPFTAADAKLTVTVTAAGNAMVALGADMASTAAFCDTAASTWNASVSDVTVTSPSNPAAKRGADAGVEILTSPEPVTVAPERSPYPGSVVPHHLRIR